MAKTRCKACKAGILADSSPCPFCDGTGDTSIRRLIKSEQPGVYMAESESRPGQFYAITGIGTPFLVCDCPASISGKNCWHKAAALKISEETMINNETNETGDYPEEFELEDGPDPSDIFEPVEEAEPMIAVPVSGDAVIILPAAGGAGSTAATSSVTVIPQQPGDLAVLDAAGGTRAMAARLHAMGEQMQLVQRFVKEQMVPESDFGTIPGTGGKATLLKPGAEKLLELYGFGFRLSDIEEDADPATGYYRVRITTSVFRRGEPDVTIVQGIGGCNSYESRYRWRQGERTCPECGLPAIIKGKAEYGGGWLCFKKKGGCGAKWDDGDPSIEGQQVGRVENDDLASTWNTVLKQAKKRSLVDATLAATRSSALFTQDLEEHVNQDTGEVTVVPVAKPAASATTARPGGNSARAPEPSMPPGPHTPPRMASPSPRSAGRAQTTAVPVKPTGAAPVPGQPYPWEDVLLDHLDAAGLKIAHLAVVVGGPVTGQRVDGWLKAHPAHTPAQLVAQVRSRLDAMEPDDDDQR